MNCSNCNQSNLPGSAFCDNCGYALNQVQPPAPVIPAHTPAPLTVPALAQVGDITCAQCHTLQAPGSMFCDNCGASLTTASASGPAQTAPPVAPPANQFQPTMSAGGLCPLCKQSVSPGAAFCDYCGANLASQAGGATVPPAQPVYPAPSPYVQPEMPSQMPMGPRMRLVVTHSGAQIPLVDKQEFYIGREDPMANFFPDADLTPHGGDTGGVSRKHARILAYGSQVMFEDLNSVNGSFVDKVRVQPNQSVALRDGAEIRLGKVVLLFQMS